MANKMTDDLSNRSEEIIFFDGQCNLCSKAVTFVLNNNKGTSFKFASLQSDTAACLVPGYATPANSDIYPKSIVLFTHGRTLIRSKAIESILLELGGGYRILGHLAKLIPLFLKEAIYDFIARNRYSWFGANEFCYMPTESQKMLFLD
jgi:predicted DCC family thiol-disulfide oxidoreductase YuxK